MQKQGQTENTTGRLNLTADTFLVIFLGILVIAEYYEKKI
jgi:hypothetical protein